MTTTPKPGFLDGRIPFTEARAQRKQWKAEHKIEKYEQKTYNAQNKADVHRDRIVAQAETAHDIAVAKQKLQTANEALHPFTIRGKVRAGMARTWEGVKTPFKWTGRKIGWTAAIVGGAGALAYLASSAKNSREFDPRTEPLPTPENDTPQVMTADDLASGAAPARTRREVVGPMTAKVLGRSGGLDITPPNTVGGDGASLIDGKPVKDLGNAAPSLS